MRFYRLGLRTVEDSSLGFAFYTSKREAEAEAKKFLKVFEDDDSAKAEITPIDVEPTRKGILEALNHYADHPDNG